MSWSKLTLRVDDDWLWAVKEYAVKNRITVTDLVIDSVNRTLKEAGHEFPSAKGQEEEETAS